MFIVKVIHNKNKIDIYYRKDEDNAQELLLMNKNLFPKAEITLEKEVK